MLAKEKINELKQSVNIIDIIGESVALTKAGRNYLGLCPFHGENTPSFNVVEDKQFYHCFGCGKSGDIFNFVQEIENIDFVEALERLAKVAGVELKRAKPNTKHKEIKEINYIATKYYYNQLMRDKKTLDYLLWRGINQD